MSTPDSKRGLARRFLLIGAWLAILLTWEGAYRLIGWKRWVFPAPTHVVDAATHLLNRPTYFGEAVSPGWPWSNPEAPGVATTPPPLREPILSSPLLKGLVTSGVRLAAGFSAAMLIGTAMGIALWRWAFLDELMGPLFLGLQTLPSVCWVPLAILVFGINESGLLFVMIMGSAFAIAIGMRDGLRSLPPVYRAAGRMLGARGFRLYSSVLIPASLPTLAGTLRQGFSFSWRSLLGAELILLAQRRGLGFLLSMGRDFSDVAQVVAMMAVMVLVGMAVDRWAFAVIERRIRLRFGLVPEPSDRRSR